MATLIEVPTATTTIELSGVEASVIENCLFDEIDNMATAAAGHFSCRPVEANDAADARWKFDRIAVCLDLLGRLGSLPPAHEHFAGTALPR